MASLPESPACFADAPLIAQDVARGVTRLFFRGDMFALCEVPLPNGRRADMVAIDARGRLIIVEIKVSRADLLGDGKWCDYLDYCDYFYWAVPAGFGARAVRRRRPRPRLRRADRRRPLRRRDRPRRAAPAARRRRAARPRPCASRAAPRAGSPATSIRGWPASTDAISAGWPRRRGPALPAALLELAQDRAPRADPGAHNRAPNCRRAVVGLVGVGAARRAAAAPSACRGAGPRRSAASRRAGCRDWGWRRGRAVARRPRPADLGGEDQRRRAVDCSGCRAARRGRAGRTAR